MNLAEEVCLLRALTRPDFWARWGLTLPLDVLSPHGRRVARAVAWCHKARRAGDHSPEPLRQADVVAILRHEGTPPKPLLEFVRQVFESTDASPEVEEALAAEYCRRGILQTLIDRALAQQQAGLVDLDALLRLLRPSAVSDRQRDLLTFDPDTVARNEDILMALPTPWPSINQQIEGLRPRELGMVLATPKVGKTKTLLNLAAAALEHQWHVLYITAADVGYLDLCRRLAATWLDEPYRQVARDPEALRTCRRQWDRLGVQVFFADYTARPCSILDIESDLDLARSRLGDEAKLAVFIDRLEEAIPAERTRELRRDIVANFAAARMLAGRYAVPVWCDSQAALREGDQGWVDITRGAESRIGKAGQVDLALGIGLDPEDDLTLRVQITGRRDLERRRFTLRVEPQSGVMRDEGD